MRVHGLRVNVERDLAVGVPQKLLNPSVVLKDAASAYKVDTDAIVLKVKQEFAAKEKEQAAKKPTRTQPKAAKKARVA